MCGTKKMSKQGLIPGNYPTSNDFLASNSQICVCIIATLTSQAQRYSVSPKYLVFV